MNHYASVWLIEQSWRDASENRSEAAFGYKPFCVVGSEDEAKSYVKEGGQLPDDYCWAMYGAHNKYRYLELPAFIFNGSVEKLREALFFYAYPEESKLSGKWRDDYPGGITYYKDGRIYCDHGNIARAVIGAPQIEEMINE